VGTDGGIEAAKKEEGSILMVAVRWPEHCGSNDGEMLVESGKSIVD
jgi:hypothetical protein